jgi:hypothetical protein
MLNPPSGASFFAENRVHFSARCAGSRALSDQVFAGGMQVMTHIIEIN